MNQEFDDFRLIEPLGEGAAGEVFLATPTKDKPYAKIGELVAIKRYKRDILKNRSQLDRIKREFDVGSTISHPNLVRIFEFCTNAQSGGRPYLVMEYVDGVPLDHWINHYHPPRPNLLLRLSSQLVEGVRHLHEESILHRDLKPQNVMVTSTFDIKIMDFGVVRVETDSKMTPPDTFLGTIRNASPEYLFGEEIDERTDLYSIGTIVYALIYGYQVYSNEDQFARLAELIKKQDPDFDSCASAQSSIIEALSKITKNLLRRHPGDRFSSASELHQAVSDIVSQHGAVDNTIFLHGYVATALTGLDREARQAIMFASSVITNVAKEYDLYVYEPRKATDPLLHKDVSASAVYKMDRKRVLAADTLFVILDRPSFGVGQEIEIATGHSVPAILISRDDVVMSRMVTGAPANVLEEIKFSTPDDLEHKLRATLSTNIERIRHASRQSKLQHMSSSNMGRRFAERRRQFGYDPAVELAESVGIAPELLEAFENGEYQNISLHLLSRLCGKIGISLQTLASKDTNCAEVAVRPLVTDANLVRLELVAKKHSLSAATFFELKEDYTSQFAARGEADSIGEKQWLERLHKLNERRVARGPERKTDQKRLFDD